MNLLRSLSFFVLAVSAVSTAGTAAKIENPWKRVPVGTVLEFRIVTEEGTSLNKETRRTEATEIWTVAANDGRSAQIDVAAAGAVKRVKKDLAPVDPYPDPPSAETTGPAASAYGAPDGREHVQATRERIETPLGTFDALRLDRRSVRLESESLVSEWRTAAFPEPLKTVSIHAGGSGVTRSLRETRLLVRYQAPGDRAGSATWRDCAVGTNFDVEVEKESAALYPPGRTPAVEKTLEKWTLLRKDARSAVFEVKIGGVRSEKSLSLSLEPPPAGGEEKRGPEERRTVILGRETITTPLGPLDCLKIRRTMSMNEADGQDLEWRAEGYPLPVRTLAEWRHKQQREMETRTLIRFQRLK